MWLCRTVWVLWVCPVVCCRVCLFVLWVGLCFAPFVVVGCVWRVPDKEPLVKVW